MTSTGIAKCKREDQRKAKRVSCILKIECRGTNKNSFHAWIRDLSVIGAFVESIETFPSGTVLTLTFRVGATELRVWGEVRSRRPHGMGLRFLNLTPEQTTLLESVVEAQSA